LKAIALISGGLDSILAARVIQEQGIQVLPLNFKIPFCQRKTGIAQVQGLGSFVMQSLGEELRVVDISSAFLDLVLRPKHGFGANMNPCIDCKIFMLRAAKELLRSLEAQFVVTGEVLGQRPMSQHRKALEIIEKESGLDGLLLRPLCAGSLQQTLPEKEGWVKRERLFRFSGRERRPQMDLARQFNIDTYPNPAGGCLLTDPRFSDRLKDLIAHCQLNIANVQLLKIGRHFRLAASAKLIVGRNEEESKELALTSQKSDYLFMPNATTAGPTCLGRGEFNAELIQLSSRIACRYCDLDGAPSVEIICVHDGESSSLEARPLSEDNLVSLRL